MPRAVLGHRGCPTDECFEGKRYRRTRVGDIISVSCVESHAREGEGDPEELLPLITQRLNPGGVLVFSHPPAIPGTSGAQGMYKGGFAGKAMYTYRYSHTPAAWKARLLGAGFAEVDAQVLDAPAPGHIGTLIVRATVT
ncbi:hypothetical protein Y717_21985 [Streptomyces scopuliridis RB72]|uniref:Methyltransferase type 11 domain-containing protein n=1 Tax=Streptomyces scopuliridis RB72 TaxID=1440053 RepID=A0A2T7SY61_9ACTN|nr:hypothetical protein Y717_21985 [Streptomyces scopuliridis RB72]